MKRLQILVPESEYDMFRRTAAASGVTLAAWVRETLTAAMRSLPRETVQSRLAAVRAATRRSFPTADIDQMLDEIDGASNADRANDTSGT